MEKYLNNLSLSKYLIYRDGLYRNPCGKPVSVGLTAQHMRFDLKFHIQMRNKLKKKYNLTTKGLLIEEEYFNWEKSRGRYKELDLFYYQVAGICISMKRAGIGSSILIRNVISASAFEYSIPVFSAGVNAVAIWDRHLTPIHRRAKRYYLRDLPYAHSKIPFNYVLFRMRLIDQKKYRHEFWA